MSWLSVLLSLSEQCGPCWHLVALEKLGSAKLERGRQCVSLHSESLKKITNTRKPTSERMHTDTHARTHARTHTNAHAHKRARTHTQEHTRI